MNNQQQLMKDQTADFFDEINSRLNSVSERLKLVNQTIDQNQGEVNRLTQKTSLATSQLQKIITDLNKSTKEEIRDAYIEAMDSQQRLLVMRGQIDRLQEQQNQLESTKTFLEEFRDSYLNDSKVNASVYLKARSIETLEMLITAQEAERQKLSRQMHDGPAQALSNFIVQAEIATKLFDIDPSKARDELDKLKNSAMSAFQKIRNFVSEVRPMMLDDLGLIPTVQKHVAYVEENTGVKIIVTINGSEKKLEPYLEVFLFRTIQELIANSIKRNQSMINTLNIEVILTLDHSKILLTVLDNGKEYSSDELKEEDGLGLTLIEERVGLLGGVFNVQTTGETGVECMLIIPVLESPVK
jgi:two-component system sensor histidine kinase DegS